MARVHWVLQQDSTDNQRVSEVESKVGALPLAAKMGFPRRPRARPVQGSSDDTTSQSTLNSLPNAKRVKLNDDAQVDKEPLLFDRESTRIYIVIAKLSPDDVRGLTRTIESNGGAVVEDFQECTLALSSTRIWNRLRKYLPPAGYVSSSCCGCDAVVGSEEPLY